MIVAQRRKSTGKEVATDEQNRFYCYRCGMAFNRLKNNFTSTHSPMYKSLGHLPICHKCVDEMYDNYLNKFQDRRAAMRRMCMKLDIYWNDDIFDMTEESKPIRSFVRGYMMKANMGRFANKSFDDTIIEEALYDTKRRSAVPEEVPDEPEEPVEEVPEPVVIEKEPEPEEPEPEIPEEYIEFWGAGFDYDFYEDLERRYKEWTNGVDDSSPSVRSLYKQICILEARINKSVAAGESIKDDMNLLNTVLGNLTLKPSQQKDDGDSSLDKIPFGVGIGWCEQHKPISEPAPEFRDVDGIVHYITAWFYGHLAKMVGIKNIKSQIYDDEISKWGVKRPRNGIDDDDEYLYETLDPGSGDAS